MNGVIHVMYPRVLTRHIVVWCVTALQCRTPGPNYDEGFGMLVEETINLPISLLARAAGGENEHVLETRAVKPTR
jgi:hypothetical protein